MARKQTAQSGKSRGRRILGWIGKIFGTLVLTGFLTLLIFL